MYVAILKFSHSFYQPFDSNLGTPIYDETFDLNDPEAQKFIFQTCIKVNSYSELVQSNQKPLLVLKFAEWAQNKKDLKFPLNKNVAPILYEFIETHVEVC